MIETIQGDILSLEEGIIVHGVNCQGRMGKGLALQIKNKYPSVYNSYLGDFINEDNLLGTINAIQINSNLWIINAFTQYSYGQGQQVDYTALRSCFNSVNKVANEIISKMQKNIPICFPKIGAGLGGGNWHIISKIIDEELSDNLIKRLYVL